jgi:hypothetical protein
LLPRVAVAGECIHDVDDEAHTGPDDELEQLKF